MAHWGLIEELGPPAPPPLLYIARHGPRRYFLKTKPIFCFFLTFWVFDFPIFLLTTGTGRIASYLGEITLFYVVRPGHKSYFLRANSILTFGLFGFFDFPISLLIPGKGRFVSNLGTGGGALFYLRLRSIRLTSLRPIPLRLFGFLVFRYFSQLLAQGASHATWRNPPRCALYLRCRHP